MSRVNEGEAEPRYRIGMASRLSGVPPHNLRKWEARYGLVAPQRTPGGGRLYSPEDVERLSRARQLVDAGMDISEVARLSDGQLDELLHSLAGGAAPTPTAADDDHALARSSAASPDVIVVGAALPVVMSEVARVNPRVRLLGVYASDQDVPDGVAVTEDTLLVIETSGFHAAAVARVEALATRLGVRGTLVFYQFANRGAISALDPGAVRAAPMPLSAYDAERDVVAAWLELLAAEDRVASAPRFSERVLATVAQATPTISCACPQHIASILMRVQAFEQYSEECITAQPDDAALHERLRDIAATARTVFESALVDVARADGIDLSTLEGGDWSS